MRAVARALALALHALAGIVGLSGCAFALWISGVLCAGTCDQMGRWLRGGRGQDIVFGFMLGAGVLALGLSLGYATVQTFLVPRNRLRSVRIPVVLLCVGAGLILLAMAGGFLTR